MSAEVYELLALAARYWFALLMVVIVLRAWRTSVTDNRGAKVMRELGGEAGCVGELVVMNTSHGRLTGARYPVPAEGILGRGRICDVRVRSRSVMRRHLWMKYANGYVTLKPIGRAAFSAPRTPDGRFVLCDGDTLQIGSLTFQMTIYDAPEIASQEREGAPQTGNPDDEFWG